jgi:hypothetical protein
MSAMVSVTSGGSRLALLAQMFTGISCLTPVLAERGHGIDLTIVLTLQKTQLETREAGR